MSTEGLTAAPEEVTRAVKQFKAAQSMGKVATQLEAQAAQLRRSVADMDLEAATAPEDHIFRIGVTRHEGALIIEPFNHRRVEWDDPLHPGDAVYENLVDRSRWGDNASIDVDTLGYENDNIWGYNSLRRVRVLINDQVQVNLVAEE